MQSEDRLDKDRPAPEKDLMDRLATAFEELALAMGALEEAVMDAAELAVRMADLERRVAQIQLRSRGAIGTADEVLRAEREAGTNGTALELGVTAVTAVTERCACGHGACKAQGRGTGKESREV